MSWLQREIARTPSNERVRRDGEQHALDRGGGIGAGGGGVPMAMPVNLGEGEGDTWSEVAAEVGGNGEAEVAAEVGGNGEAEAEVAVSDGRYGITVIR